jgi:hypothetical protein
MSIITNKKTKDTGSNFAKEEASIKWRTLQQKHITCTKSFRTLTEQLYPGLNSPKTSKGRKAYWEMFLYCLAGIRTPEHTNEFKSNKLLLTWQIVSRIQHGYIVPSKDSDAFNFLLKFREDVFGGDPNIFDWYCYDSSKGIARTLKTFNLHPQLQKAYEQERRLREWVASDRVYFVDGIDYSGRKSKKIQDEYRLEALLNIDNLPEKLQPNLEKLNEQPVNTFATLAHDNYNYALDTARRLTVKHKSNLHYRDAIRCNEDCLYSIRSAPQPIYTCTDTPGSTRIQTFGQNLTRLSRPVRAAYLRGIYNCDLASIQLAIAAKVLNVKSILDFLHTGQSFWTLILDYLDIEDELRPAVKSVIKTALYSILFGKEVSKLKAELTCSFGDKSYGQKFIEHPYISELVKAMDAKRQQIEQQGYYVDAFNRKIETFKDSKSALALLIQSWESLIMSALYELDFKDNQYKYKFIIVAHLHDGVYIKFNNKKNADTYLKQIRQAIHNKLQELQIPSKFEYAVVSDQTIETLLIANKLEADIAKYDILYLQNELCYDIDDYTYLEELQDQYKEQTTQQESLPTEPSKIDAPSQSIIEEQSQQLTMTQPIIPKLPKFTKQKLTIIYDRTQEWNVIKQYVKDNTLYITVESCFNHTEAYYRGYTVIEPKLTYC